jgi:hypothetical protein
LFDIVTHEVLATVPPSSRSTVTINSRVELSATLGEDKTVDSATLELNARNFNVDNPVTVDISIADEDQPGLFRPVVTFDLAPSETRDIEVVQTEPDDALVRASQSSFVNLRFISTSPAPGIGQLEFRFRVRVIAHKSTPGSGPGTLLFY